MIIKPKTRGFICTTAHPAGCRKIVADQIEYAKKHRPDTIGVIGSSASENTAFNCKKVLVIGSSMGYGLSARIAAAYTCGASTIGIIFDKEGSEKRTASAGWYNTAAFEEFAHADGLYAKTINGDAFSQEIKQQTIELIKADFGKVDTVIYSLAAPRRTTADGTTYTSVLKTTEGEYTNKTIDLKDNTVGEVSIEPATAEEIENTVKVMGGEDWMDWMTALTEADVLEKDAVTVAFSYIGPEITHPIYKNGSIGKAKEHLFKTSKEITEKFEGITAYTSVNKALVTQSSTAIPVVPLYISILFKVMKENGNHEGCIEQMTRLFTDKLSNGSAVTDADGMIRLDDYEMDEKIQAEVLKIWDAVTTENVMEKADIKGFWDDFFALFGFGADGVDYEADTDPVYNIESLS